MSSDAFDKAYQGLNLAQREAVDTIEGPVMVAAGPGTGKTQILAFRIANILLKTQAEPENILAVTFTKSGVVSMRRRLADMVGTPAYRVKIATFHSFCEEVIREYPEHFPHISGGVSVDEVEQLKILEEVIDSIKLKHLKLIGNEYFYLKDIVRVISKLKQEGVAPKKLEAFMMRERESFDKIDDLYNAKGKYAGQMKGKYVDLLKQIEKGLELAQVYELYQAALRAKRLYDYNDMILEVREALEHNKDLLLLLQEQYQYILVDEHQDTNNAQNRVLELLASFYDVPNLFVVGDEKQAIYKFQGASLENFRYFRDKYPMAKLVVLEDNYRSSQLILDLAHSLLSGEKKLISRGGKADEKINLYELNSEEGEDYFVATDITRRIKAGGKPEEIAVFYHDNADLAGLPAALDRQGVPYVILASEDILADDDVRKLVILFEAIADFGDEEKFFEALHIDFLGLEPLDVYKLIRAGNNGRVSVLSLISRPEKLAELDLLNPAKVKGVVEMLSELARRAKNTTLLKIFEQAVRDSGYLASVLSGNDPVLAVRKLNAFFDEVKKMVERNKKGKLSDLISYLRRLENHEIKIKKTTDLVSPGRVRLMTAHRSKGLEFDHIYIIRAADGRWGNKRRPDKLKLPAELFAMEGVIDETTDKNDEERRLFYVALTRAKESITISLSDNRSDGREQVPTQFLAELDQALVEKRETEALAMELSTKPELAFSQPPANPGSMTTDFVRELFQKRGFAVTHLNNYLTCPWRYFYVSLLRLPQAPTKSQLYGIATHAALKDYFDKRNDEPEKGLDYLLARYDEHLAKLPLLEKDFTDLLEIGHERLSAWFTASEKDWAERTINEYKVKGVALTEGITLTGAIDKIELLDADGLINMVDYKTSKPKTRGEILGETKNSTGDIKRQLTFYKLLFDHYDQARFKFQSAEVDFLNADSKGRFKKEKFVITNEEVTALEEEIKRVADEIVNLKFWNKKCDDAKCEFCKLRGMMKE